MGAAALTPAFASSAWARRRAAIRVAWRLQTHANGGIEPGLRRRLRGQGRVGEGLERGGRIVREWRGQRHEVEVVDGGYLWNGRRFKSLSPIAFEITGARWNGPKFFGLRPG